MQDEEIAELVRKKVFLIKAFLHTSSLPNEKLEHAVSGYFLQAVVLELVIKAFYELDLKECAPFTHKVVKLYGQLPEESRNFLESKFDEARAQREKQFAGVENIQFHSFEEILHNNEAIVTSFKYDAKAVSTNSSADSVFYQAVLERIGQKTERLNS